MAEDIKFKLITYVDTDFEAKKQTYEYFIELEDGVERSLKDILIENVKLKEQQDTISRLKDENEQLHHELEQIKEYLQIKIDECKNHKKMEEIVFGVEQAVGYKKALLQFQKGLKRRLNYE